MTSSINKEENCNHSFYMQGYCIKCGKKCGKGEIKKATKEISKTFGRAIKRLGEEDWRKRFSTFFVSIGGGTTLDSEENVVAQKENIIDFIRTEREKAKKEGFEEGKEIGNDDFNSLKEEIKQTQKEEIRKKIKKMEYCSKCCSPKKYCPSWGKYASAIDTKDLIKLLKEL